MNAARHLQHLVLDRQAKPRDLRVNRKPTSEMSAGINGECGNSGQIVSSSKFS